jgi:hypothetical protein
MPIANCVVSKNCTGGSANLIEVWAADAGISPEHMTVNMVSCEEQLGNRYKIMATLLLPSLWSSSEISRLQLGLARSLAQYFEIPMNEVHVITHIVSSGLVVESGQEVEW